MMGKNEGEREEERRGLTSSRFANRLPRLYLVVYQNYNREGYEMTVHTWCEPVVDPEIESRAPASIFISWPSV